MMVHLTTDGVLEPMKYGVTGCELMSLCFYSHKLIFYL